MYFTYDQTETNVYLAYETQGGHSFAHENWIFSKIGKYRHYFMSILSRVA